MKTSLFSILLILSTLFTFSGANASKPIHILVVTGGHGYKVEPFNEMLESLGDNISYQVVELPAAYTMFLPENRNKYDVLVFYHMWQEITDDQAKIFSDCIKLGKPVVALHHSICAYDDWPEYFNIIGG